MTEQSRAKKRQSARDREKKKLMTFGEFSFWVDQYHNRMVEPRLRNLEFGMLPFWKRWRLTVKAWWASRRERPGEAK